MIPSLLRSRFSNTLESHQIDEDYSESNTAATASATSLSNSNSGQLTQQPPSPVMVPPTLQQPTNPLDPSTAATNPTTTTNELPFDPYEVVPSYEASQRMHNQGILTPIDDLTRPTQIYTPIPSLPMPQSMAPQAVPMTESTSSTESTLNNLIISSSSTRVNMMKRTSIKQLGLKFLNARQHFLLAFCRDVSLIPPVIGLVQSWRLSYYNDHALDVLDNSPRGCEYFLTGLWCIVSAYLSYSILDSLLVRWIVTYLTSAAIVRVLSMLTIIITIELFLVGAFSSDSGQKYGLHIWLLISCFLTFVYIVQNFVTSNLEITSRKGIRKKARFFDFYNIVVFAVVPVGLASFVTMIGLLRSLLLLRMDIDQKLLA
ncbi:N-glycosylation protein EOS1 [Candida viswanathii]|uniref:N-glycosylation protein EOS1 n=1 Tax=Candida viswanathii TaxID=5486 RepID=A0A367YK90_9ASCO|nr:N-glycosylation protein EOS1 [Candida viswanathii]